MGAHGHCTRVGSILDGLRPLPALSCDGAGHWPHLPRDAHSWQPALLTSRQAAVGERWSLQRPPHPAPGNQRVCGWNYVRISNGDHPDGSGSSQPNDRCPRKRQRRSPVRTEAETGVMWPQGEGGWEPWMLRGWGGCALSLGRGAGGRWHLTSSFCPTNCKGVNFSCLKYSSLFTVRTGP